MATKRDYIQVLLTCTDSAEAGRIAAALLDQRLIACAKIGPVSSQFAWHGKIDRADEVLVIMDSAEDLFAEVERIVDELHSYDTPNLQAVPVVKLSRKTANWMAENLKEAA